jgi:hypothetical protein
VQNACSGDASYYSDRFLVCYRNKDFCGGRRISCLDFCQIWMACSGNLNINSDGIGSVFGSEGAQTECVCADGFWGDSCQYSNNTDVSQTDDIETPTDTAVSDEGGPTDTVVSDEGGPTDTAVSDEGGPTDVPSPDVPVLPVWIETCNAWNAALAERKVVCLKANPDYLAGRPGALDCTILKDDIDDGLTTYDATKADACTAFLQALPCQGLVSTTSIGPFEFPIPDSDCEGVLVGTGVSSIGEGTGTACRRSTQCASGYCTTRTFPGQCPGVCEDRKAEGIQCTHPQQCANGLTCVQGTCSARGTTGTDCFMDETCAADLRCLDFTCQPMLNDGQSCAFDLQCKAEARCFNNTCQPIVGLNGPCTEAIAPNMPTVCGQGYWCNSDTCAAWPTVGQSCTDSPGCTGGYCDLSGNEPTCAAYLATGDTCTSKFQCASELASFDKCVAWGDFYCTNP